MRGDAGPGLPPRPTPSLHHPAGGAGPLPRFHLPARLSHRLEERAADEAHEGRDVHVADLAFRAGPREAAAEALVPQVRLGVAFEDLAEDREVFLAGGGRGASVRRRAAGPLHFLRPGGQAHLGQRPAEPAADGLTERKFKVKGSK